MAATIKDIARRLNISTSTVSYALNGGPRSVPDEVKQRVLEMARELDYRPNRVARSLVTRRANAIGVVPPSTEQNVFLSPFVRNAWNAIVNEAEVLEQDLLLFTGHNRNLPDQTGNELLDGRIDGVVFIAPRPDTPAMHFLAQRNFPFTSIASGEAVPGVRFNCDNAGGVRMAIEHLRSLGHRRIAHVTGSLTSLDGQQRLDAFSTTLAAMGLGIPEGYIQQANFTIEAGYAAGLAFLKLEIRPTAVFAGNDEEAYGLCQAFREAGVRVPEDISVVGFDDADLSYAFNPPMTTIRQPVIDMASSALRATVDLANGIAVSSAEFPTELVIRGSTARLT